MGSITASPVAPDLELADFIDFEIDQSIPQDALTRVLSRPPFRIVEGVFNIRDLGHIGHPGIQPGLVYRSGLLANLTEVGKSQLVSELSLGAVFDLRVTGKGTPPPVNLSDFTANDGNDAHGPERAPGAAGFKQFAAIKASYMMAFLEAVQVKYGGMETFVVDVIGMSKADVEAVRAVLRGESLSGDL
ncbi:hypothetical protein Aspvir_007030 [Aspergillus viridinutans]|uniref:Uncharacterized protein n=1 Tax=Aspergillus viridinutans TaxID=75553 RepID=A0A9P3F5Z1_ASPVI|nr:uncharacterized protein Aspvir_007030 [Aspergillus viridinutans]GIK02965.1 hypothetical protein Aspvir_007030 [Aspergillus viridinutans]